MARPQRLPGKDELRRLLRKHTQREIARMYDVTASTVSMAAKKYGFTQGLPKERDKWIPWKVRNEHQNDRMMRALRSRVRMERGLHVSDEQRALVDAHFNTLEARKLVVGYDPDIGWFTARRRGREKYTTRRTPAAVNPERFAEEEDDE